MTQKRKRGLGKNAFGEINMEAIVTEDVEEGTKMLKMRREIRTGNKNIIKINKHKGEVTQDIVHETLESLSRIFQTKRHGEKFIEAERRDDSRFGDIGGGDRNLMITFSEIQFREDGGTMEARGKILEIGKRVSVMNCLEGKVAIIAARPP